jgi:L-serine dehydratase
VTEPFSSPLLSIFDVLGPIMIGPSSSHTAGAVRIGKMGRQILGEAPTAVALRFYGSLAETYKGHMTDTAVVAGLLGMDVDDPRIPGALALAREHGLHVAVQTESASDRNPNTIEMVLRTPAGARRVVGISVGGGEICMTGIDEHSLRLDGKAAALLVFGEKDAPLRDGVTRLLGEDVRSSQASRGEAEDLLTLHLHRPVTPDLLRALGQLPGVRSVREIPPLYDYGSLAAPPLFGSVQEMLALCASRRGLLPQLVIDYETGRSGLAAEAVRMMLRRIWAVMREGAAQGLAGQNRLVGGIMDGQDGRRLLTALRDGRLVSGRVLPLAIARALACMEVNAAMGKVVAAPTAGSCGVLPGVLSAVAEERRCGELAVIDALLVASIFGVLIARVAPVSGALGGCQSEVGVASAMAAAGTVQLAGGTPDQTAQGMALALKSVLGLVCDPVAGPVEVPCIKRNAIGVANALAAADMALAGIQSVVPPDEVILALRNVQTLLPMELRDTTLGGLGITPTAQRLKAEWLKRCNG